MIHLFHFYFLISYIHSLKCWIGSFDYSMNGTSIGVVRNFNDIPSDSKCLSFKGKKSYSYGYIQPTLLSMWVLYRLYDQVSLCSLDFCNAPFNPTPMYLFFSIEMIFN